MDDAFLTYPGQDDALMADVTTGAVDFQYPPMRCNCPNPSICPRAEWCGVIRTSEAPRSISEELQQMLDARDAIFGNPQASKEQRIRYRRRIDTIIHTNAWRVWVERCPEEAEPLLRRIARKDKQIFCGSCGAHLPMERLNRAQLGALGCGYMLYCNKQCRMNEKNHKRREVVRSKRAAQKGVYAAGQAMDTSTDA